MMRSIAFFLISFIFSVAIKANGLSEMADSAYAADNFQEAADIYLEIIRDEGNSPILQYNLGNCYYRLGELGKSILAYERALRLDPRFEDARTNLAFVNTKIVDRPGERGTFISNAFDKVANNATSNVWAWISLGLFFLLIVGFGLYYFSPSITLKKTGFFSGIVLVFLTLGALILSFRARQISTYPNFAVITSPSVILSTSPRDPKDRNEEAILLHEGTKVEILDSISTHTDSIGTKWYDVEIDNSHRAWIKSSEVERI